MAKSKSYYLCSNCGYKSVKWMGKCPECGSWNSFAEEVELSDTAAKSRSELISGKNAKPVRIDEVSVDENERIFTKIPEFDRVLGGLVAGQAVMLSGEPGVGKSTLLLQIANALAAQGKKVIYVNGEESNAQVALRAKRLSAISENLFLLCEPNIDAVVSAIRKVKPDFVFLDSLQTAFIPRFDSLPGSLVQVRESAHELTSLCKGQNIGLFLVSHITKSGNIAGPKVVEHIVDTVLFFESDKRGMLRLLRAFKNRFAATDELGLFEMRSEGMVGVENPAELFLEERSGEVIGTAVFPYLEGNRVFPVEVQALCSPTQFNYPKRAADGMETNRLQMLVAILEKQLKISLMPFDIYVNVTGGLEIREPALDLAVMVAIYSSFKEKAFPLKIPVFGETGLTGEIRSVRGVKKRIAELQRLGFEGAFLPGSREKLGEFSGLKLRVVHHISEAIALI